MMYSKAIDIYITVNIAKNYLFILFFDTVIFGKNFIRNSI